jgi:hypothetical protein
MPGVQNEPGYVFVSEAAAVPPARSAAAESAVATIKGASFDMPRTVRLADVTGQRSTPALRCKRDRVAAFRTWGVEG